MSSRFWKLMGESSKPEKSPDRRLAYIKALERLLVAGTAGTFFFAFARSIPANLKGLSCPLQFDYIIDLFLRYGYLLWLLAYFFVSSVNNDQEKYERHWRDITFDVGQTFLSLTSAILLGLIIPEVR